MTAPKAKPVQRRQHLTSEQAEHYRRIAAAVEADPSSLHDENGPMVMGDVWELLFTISDLKKHRQKQGKSLADIEASTGIKASTLSRLESGKVKNPQLATLSRYARALGKRLALKLAPPEAEPKTGRPRAAARGRGRG